MPTPTQANRLLTGAFDKTWVKVSSRNDESGAVNSCEVGVGDEWNLNAKDTLLTINYLQSCNTVSAKTKFFLDTLQGKLRLRFLLPPRTDTITRIITYVTDREFIAEYNSISAGASGVFVETFRKKVDQ